jgi:hypothetical protein
MNELFLIVLLFFPSIGPVFLGRAAFFLLIERVLLMALLREFKVLLGNCFFILSFNLSVLDISTSSTGIVLSWLLGER